MSTLSLKPNINTQLLESIQAQNEYIISLLEENNKLLKQKQSKPKSKDTFYDTVAYTTAINTISEFSDGNNYNTVVKLAKWCRKWEQQYINEINAKLQDVDMSDKNKGLFLKLIDKMNKA